MRPSILTLLIAALLIFLGGCEPQNINAGYLSPPQFESGLVLILPGIQGIDDHYVHIRNGLAGAGIHCAIKIHAWGSEVPGLNLAINETNVAGNRKWGQRIAADIVAYQQQYPGRPVYLIGQSGGAGISVFAAEALGELGGQPIAGIILLDASVSASYDLGGALAATREGIVNFYNEKDVALLAFGTAVMGNIDGGHGASAGRTGFSSQADRLYQVDIQPDMIDDFADPHFADCSQAFAAQFIAPWIIDRNWPPLHMEGLTK